MLNFLDEYTLSVAMSDHFVNTTTVLKYLVIQLQKQETVEI